MTLDATPGFYGKLPVLGDFFSRRLPRDFIDPWDQWLQSAIATSREELGQDWLSSYLTSPLWRFALSAGVIGNSGWMGVLMPSVDRVGRYFPLTLALAVSGSADLLALFTANVGWYASIESVALTALEDNLDLDGLDRLLEQVEPPLIEPVYRDAAFIYPEPGKNAVYIEADQAQPAEAALAALLGHFLTEPSRVGQTFWGSLGAEHVSPFVLHCQGLPPVHAFTGFMNGSLSDRGWRLEQKKLVCDSSGTVGSPAENNVAGPDRPIENRNQQHVLLKQNGPWQSCSVSDVGKRRTCNEDAVLNRPEAGLWAVADGMGGHSAGDVASGLIVKALDELIITEELDESIQKVRRCLKKTNEDLRDLAENRFNRQIVGSTVVVMLANERQGACLWAGDSRLYRLREGRLKQLTMDHSEAGQPDAMNPLALEKVLKPCNVITRAVGADDDLLLDCALIDIRPSDKFLLCSDGLDKEVGFDELEAILNANDCQSAVTALLELALNRNARDNVSIVGIEMLTGHA